MKRGLTGFNSSGKPEKKKRERNPFELASLEENKETEDLFASGGLLPNEEQDERLKRWALQTRDCLSSYIRSHPDIQLPREIIEWTKEKISPEAIFGLMLSNPAFRQEVFATVGNHRDSLPDILDWEESHARKEQQTLQEIQRVYEKEKNALKFLYYSQPRDYLGLLVEDSSLFNKDKFLYWQKLINRYLEQVTPYGIDPTEITWRNIISDPWKLFEYGKDKISPQSLLDYVEMANDERAKIDNQIKELIKNENVDDFCQQWPIEDEKLRGLCDQRNYSNCWEVLTPEALFRPDSIVARYLKSRYGRLAKT